MSRAPGGLPLLPLLLWRTPPGLALALAQEGIAHEVVDEANPQAFRRGRFVLYDGRCLGRDQLTLWLTPRHAAIDVRRLDPGGGVFEALIDTEARPTTWRVDGVRPTERIGRVDRAKARDAVLAPLRRQVVAAGGVWARLGAFPHPYRSAFNLRVDLDEPFPDDYAAFARARRPLEDCTTHFVSTAAYGADRPVLADLRERDVQSHGHHHVVYRSPAANGRNLERAHAILTRAGIGPVGFAAPEGRWNLGLDAAISALGYIYSSDFQLGWDDRPFFPWLGHRFSDVLQVPIHPICEGLFFEAGVTDGRRIADYYARAASERIADGEAAFVYGHPERRLARLPEVLEALAGIVRGADRVWRVTLTRYASWWRWRHSRRWSLEAVGDEPDRYEVRFAQEDRPWPLALEIVRGEHVAMVPVTGPRTILNLRHLGYQRPATRADRPHPAPAPRAWGVRPWLRAALDWETVTPLAELPTGTVRERLKKSLRAWREAGDRR